MKYNIKNYIIESKIESNFNKVEVLVKTRDGTRAIAFMSMFEC